MDLVEERAAVARAARERWQAAERRVGALRADPKATGAALGMAERACAAAERTYQRREREYVRALEARWGAGS